MNKIEHTVCNWFVNMSYTDTSKKDDDISIFINNLHRYYEKKKPIGVSKQEHKLFNDKLETIQRKFEETITIEEDRHLLADRESKVRTMEFSPTLLALLSFDNLVTNKRDIQLRLKFGHIDIGNMLLQIEEEVPDLSMSSYKAYKELLKEM